MPTIDATNQSSKLSRCRRFLFPNLPILLELLNSGQNASPGRKYLYWIVVVAYVFPMVILGICLLEPILRQLVTAIQPALNQWGVVDFLRLLSAAPARRGDHEVLLRVARLLYVIGFVYPFLVVKLRIARQLVLGKQATLIVDELYYPARNDPE